MTLVLLLVLRLVRLPLLAPLLATVRRNHAAAIYHASAAFSLILDEGAISVRSDCHLSLVLVTCTIHTQSPIHATARPSIEGRT